MSTDIATTSKQPVTRRPGLRSAFRVGLAQVILVVCGVIFIHRDVYLHGNLTAVMRHWQEQWVCGAMLVDGIIRGAYGMGPYISPFHKRILRWGLPVGLFFYAACATLCVKLNVGALNFDLWRNAGVAILSLSLVLNLLISLSLPIFVRGDEGSTVITADEEDQEKRADDKPDLSTAKFEAKGIWRFLRYPDRFAIMLMLIGLSLALGAWIPLLALPGLFVAFKWEIADLESFRISQFGDAYLNYRKTSWALLPFIY